MPHSISQPAVGPASGNPPQAFDPADDDLNAGWAALPPAYRIPDTPPSLAEAEAYCRRLATSHYENFAVVTWFLPAHLHRHFYSVYAYCRIADDLGDEVGHAARSCALLDAWEVELDATYRSLAAAGEPVDAACLAPSDASRRAGEPALARAPRHPVFLALRETIRACRIPRQPFADLLTAFRRDQTITRFPTFDDVLDYCHYSANPVGRLVLYVCGYGDDARQQLSDCTCTALQLANFWQDVSVDYRKGRIYLPGEDLVRFGVSEADIGAGRFTPAFRELMRFEVARARDWFARGLPLVKLVSRPLAIDIELFSRGGQQILNAIERQDFDVLRSRPRIPRWRKLALVLGAAVRARLVR
jgi:squalene synthase HpnC